MHVRIDDEWRYAEQCVRIKGRWRGASRWERIAGRWVLTHDSREWSLYELEWEDDDFWEGRSST